MLLWCYLYVAKCYACYPTLYKLFFFFFKQKTAYEMRISDWSSDVCSSDLLSNASRQPKIERLAQLTQQNQARISAVAQARADLEGFADSLSQMVDDGTLRSTPTVSDESVLSATARAGLHADSFAATIEVTQLARAQTAYSAIIADREAAIGQGTLTLRIGGTD